MHDFLLKELSNIDLVEELNAIGFDKSYAKIASSKFQYKNFKIYNLSVAQANILKQTALSVGADCGTHKDVITGKQDFSCVILGGSLSQLKKITDKLNFQPFKLKSLAQSLNQKIQPQTITKTQLVGVLNLTRNSFSDGGEFYDFNNSITHLHKLVEDGADIIDIGAETTKAYSEPVLPDEQLQKLEPVLNYVRENKINVDISVDTRSAKVAQKSIELGAKYINDVSGFDFDDEMVDVIAKNGAKIIIQHSQGTPNIMQIDPHYENLMDEIYIDLYKKVDFAISKGILKENIIIDPGIGFGKTRDNNFEILKRWKELKTIGCPVMIGLSRKSLLNLQDCDNSEKDMYSLALNSILINENVDFIRIHNVKIHKKFMEMIS